MELFKEKKDYTEKASKKKMAGNFEFRARIVVDIYIYIYITNFIIPEINNIND
jgi:hypothetical protein